MRNERVHKAAEFLFPARAALKAALICSLAGIVLVPLAAWALQQPNNPPRVLPDFINRLPDVNDQARMRQGQVGQQDNEALKALLQKRVADDSAKLLKLAADLKEEVDKSGKNTLSLNAIRKAEAIEKLAKSIKGNLAQEARTN